MALTQKVYSKYIDLQNGAEYSRSMSASLSSANVQTITTIFDKNAFNIPEEAIINKVTLYIDGKMNRSNSSLYATRWGVRSIEYLSNWDGHAFSNWDTLEADINSGRVVRNTIKQFSAREHESDRLTDSYKTYSFVLTDWCTITRDQLMNGFWVDMDRIFQGGLATTIYGKNYYIIVDYTLPVYVTYDSIFNFQRWKNSGITMATAGSISNITNTGFSIKAGQNDSYTNISPLFSVSPNTAYTLKYDAVGNGHEMFVFCDGQIVTGRFWSTRNGVLNFTTPSDCTTIAVRCDSNNSGTTVTYSNIRIYPTNYSYMADSVSQTDRIDVNSWSMPTPQRTGYDFIGWNTKPGGTGTTYTSAKTFPSSDLVLYSQWQIKRFTIRGDSLPKVATTISGVGTYDYGTTITITAIPPIGYRFVRWSDGTTNATRTVTVTANKTYTALVEKLSYTISASASPIVGGTISNAGTYEYGSIIQLNAIPSINYKFLYWGDGDTSTSKIITVTENKSYTAYFEYVPPEYTIITVASPESGGRIIGGGTFVEDTNITLQAIPNANYNFVGWSDKDTNPEKVITVTQNDTYIAYFELKPIDKVKEIYVGGTQISDLYSGDKPITEVYIGNTLVYQF